MRVNHNYEFRMPQLKQKIILYHQSKLFNILQNIWKNINHSNDLNSPKPKILLVRGQQWMKSRTIVMRGHSRYGLSQWEATLQCNVVFHWLSPYTKLSLKLASFNCLFRRKSKKTPKLRVTDLCAGNSPGTGEFPAQMASNAENVSIWWRHHAHKQINHRHHRLA